MKKFFIFVLICCLGMSMTSCRYFDVPVEAEVLGYGTVGQDTEKGFYYAEMDSARYVLDKIYSNGDDKHDKMPPVEGMKVTCFRTEHSPEVEFIAGELSAEYLSGYFADNIAFVFCSLVIACWAVWWVIKLVIGRKE